MSYTYGNGMPFQPEIAPTNWGTQFYGVDQSPSQQHEACNGFANPGQDLTTENLMLNSREDCDLIESQIFPEGPFTGQGLMQGHQVNVKTEQDIDMLQAQNSTSGVTSSDKSSSPSTIFNNLPLTSQDLKKLNGSIQDDKNQGLTEQEIANRRKAQNRAAQRAFRERKEMKLKELEEKLKESESDKAELKKQLDLLNKQNIVITTENKLLLQKGPSSDSPASQLVTNGSFSFPVKDKFHMEYSQITNQRDNPEIPYDMKRLTVTEVWEYLNELDLDFDIQTVMERLKGSEVCHKAGPAYLLKTIDTIIEEEKLSNH